MFYIRSLITFRSALGLDSRVVIYKAITIQGMIDTPLPVAAQDTLKTQVPRKTGTEKPIKRNPTQPDSRLSEVTVRNYKIYDNRDTKVKVRLINYKMSSALTNLLQSLRIVPFSSKAMVAASEKERLKVKDLPEISLEEVAQHDSFDDCWVVIYDRVYDVTLFLRDHPGGDDVIIDHAGRDATIAFHGTGHSRDAIELMRNFLIGELPVKQHIFRTGQNKVLSSGIPE